MEEIQLKVEKAYPIDLGRAIIRLDPITLVKLQIEPHDIVEIRGKKKTAATVWRADKKDWDKKLASVDKFIRQNAGVSIGETVTVKKVEAAVAKKLILALPESMTQAGGPELQFGEHANEIIKRHILNRPIFKGDIIPIINSMTHSMAKSLTTSQVIPLVAVETDPANAIVLITDSTRIELRKKPVQGYETVVKGVTYEDIGGLGEEIMRVREMIELPMKYPELFVHLNVEPPKGVILHGPSGTGKTMIAKAIANESGASFHYIDGSVIVGKFYGESEERLRKVFEEAIQDAPSVIFIDDIDSIALKRENAGEVERRVIAQLFTLLDEMENREQVVVIGATNRLYAIDPAFRRQGRFDREIHIGMPDTKARYEILEIHTKGMPIDTEVEYLMELAERTQGFVGADLLALVQEAAMRCLREKLSDFDFEKETIPQERLEEIVVTRKNFEDALIEVEARKNCNPNCPK